MAQTVVIGVLLIACVENKTPITISDWRIPSLSNCRYSTQVRIPLVLLDQFMSESDNEVLEELVKQPKPPSCAHHEHRISTFPFLLILWFVLRSYGFAIAVYMNKCFIDVS